MFLRFALPLLFAIQTPMTGSAQHPVQLRLDAPNTARVGERVSLTIIVENPTDRPVDLYLRGRQIAFDVVVTDSDGVVVWRRLEGEIIPAIVQLKSLAPREVLALRTTWEQRSNRGRPLAAGLYSVRGLVLTDDAQAPLETAAVELRILPN
jgi:hypothetical protein